MAWFRLLDRSGLLATWGDSEWPAVHPLARVCGTLHPHSARIETYSVGAFANLDSRQDMVIFGADHKHTSVERIRYVRPKPVRPIVVVNSQLRRCLNLRVS